MPSRSLRGSKRSRLDEARARLHQVFEGAPTEEALARIPAEERLKLAFELSLEIEAWAKKYVAHYLVDQETGAAIDFAEFHRDLFRLLLTDMHLVVQAPREHAKSTIGSFIFVLFCICHKLRRFIVLLSDTQPQATLLLDAVKTELEINDALREDFGDLVDDRKWGEQDVVTSTDVRLSARGAGQSLRGLRHRMRRPDLVICDDLENDEAVESVERREKLESWFVGTVLNLGKKCQVIVIGTVLHYDALLAKLLSEDQFPTFVKKFYTAVDDDWNPESVLWPGRWPLEALREKLKQIGSVMFDREFRGRPINSATQVFRPEWVNQHAFVWSEIRDVALMKIMGVDPAISLKQTADFFGRVVIGIAPTGHIFVLRGEQHKIMFTDQVKLLLQKIDTEQPDWIGIETAAYQKALKQRMDEVTRETGRYIPIVEVGTKGIDNYARISTMGPLVENGTIRFCLDGTQDTLLKQLYFLGKMKDDVATALEIAVRVAREKRFNIPALLSSDPVEDSSRRERRGVFARAAADTTATGWSQTCAECGKIVPSFYENDRGGVTRIRDCKNCDAPLPPAMPPEEASLEDLRRMFMRR